MDKKVGVLGGGQLGRMLVEAANRLNIQVNVLDKELAPAKQISAHDGHISGSFKDEQSIRILAEKCDVITVEIEHVDTKVLAQIQTPVEPSAKTITTIQDKYLQKQHLIEGGIATAESVAIEHKTVDELTAVGNDLGLPFMLKARKDAYDGRGNFPVRSASDFQKALEFLGDRQLYAEKWADFRLELAVNVVQTKDGPLAFPTVETIHEDSICKLVYAPARNVSAKISQEAQELAKRAVATFTGKGVYGVEMFLLKDDTLLINEIAPRPHNSGHYTIEACPLSQYDAHLRAILDLPIPESSLQIREPAIMLNILGGSQPDSHFEVAKTALSNPRTSIHLYGKGAGTKGRKMGHMTVTASTMAEAETLIQPLIDIVDKVKGKAIDEEASLKKQNKPLVAVIMGSDSDMNVLQAGVAVLEKLKIPYTSRITSAHRTPEHMATFVSSAASNGLEVIIAAAGGAAHLPGMAAAYTALPVIGVPVRSRTALDGMDSLLSEVQMPAGVPVATIGINNSTNAALLAARILGIKHGWIQRAVEDYAANSKSQVLGKDATLADVGFQAYFDRFMK